MFRVTSAAAATLLEACQQEGMASESAGVRVAGTVDESGTLSLEIMLQEEPEPTDQVTDQEGIRVFVAPEVTEPLAGLELDVAEGEEGSKLRLQDQSSGS